MVNRNGPRRALRDKDQDRIAKTLGKMVGKKGGKGREIASQNRACRGNGETNRLVRSPLMLLRL
jgi:hypothetical protein